MTINWNKVMLVPPYNEKYYVSIKAVNRYHIIGDKDSTGQWIDKVITKPFANTEVIIWYLEATK